MELITPPRPAVSIVIPVYNLEKYLGACLDSVLGQTFGDFEAVVVNDGSTDGSEAVLRRYADRDPRIRLFTTPNQGAARARGTALSHARGEYVCFLDADDYFEPDMLERLTGAIAENGGYDIVVCNYRRVSRTYQNVCKEKHTEDMQGLEYLEAILRHRIWVGIAIKLYRRELFDMEINHHPLRLGEDAMINIQIASHNAPRVRFIDYAGYNYVQRADSATHASVLSFDDCRKFCAAMEQEVLRHDRELGGRAKFYVVMSKLYWYMLYMRKSRNPWIGNSDFARALRADVAEYRTELEPYYPRSTFRKLAMNRWRFLRPVMLAESTFKRWSTSLKRRLGRS